MAGKSFHLIKSALAWLGKYLKRRRRMLRLGVRYEARLPFLVTLLGSRKGSAARSAKEAPTLLGFTRDLSETGMTLLLPSLRLGGAYLTDIESYLEVKLELPGGAITIRTASVRFEQLPRREADCSYLLAVRIVNMQHDERDRYIAYLKSLGLKKKGTSVETLKQTAGAEGSFNASPAGKWEALTPASVNQAYEQFVQK
jgi:hypothetical protein